MIRKICRQPQTGQQADPQEQQHRRKADPFGRAAEQHAGQHQETGDGEQPSSGQRFAGDHPGLRNEFGQRDEYREI